MIFTMIQNFRAFLGKRQIVELFQNFVKIMLLKIVQIFFPFSQEPKSKSF